MDPSPLPAPLHARLTVVRADAGTDAAELARHVADGLEHAAGAGTCAVVGAAEVRRRAIEATVAAHHDRAAARDEALAHREGLATRRTHLLERAEWCEATATAARALSAARAAAEEAITTARAELDAAAARRDRVAEQRALAQAAVEEAKLELEGLDGASLDETGVRRELEAATRTEREVKATLAAAEAEVAALQSRLAHLDEARDDLAATRESITAPASSRLAEAAVAAAVADALAYYDELAERAGPHDGAAALADRLASVEWELEELRRTLPDPPTLAQLDGAEADVAAARRRLDATRAAAAAFGGPPPEWWVELTVLHARVVDAETALQTAGLRKAAARNRYEEALAAERARLDELGFDSYLDALMSGGRLAEDRARDEATIARDSDALAAAEATLEQLRSDYVAGAPLVDLLAEHGRLVADAAGILGCDPGGRAVELLRQHPAVPPPVIAELADALRPAGVATTRVGVAAAARAWLATQPTGDDPDRLAEIDRDLAELAGERHDVEQALAAAVTDAEQASAAVAAAGRNVAALEAELYARAGDDSRLLERMTAAHALRDQVEAVEARLAAAEAEARQAWAAHDAALVAAEAERDRLDRELAELSRQASRTAAELPAARRPAFDLLTEMVPLAGALRAEAGTLADLLADADAVLAAAEAAAGRGPDHPTADDLAAGVTAAVRDAGAGAATVVLAEPVAGADADALDVVLAAVLDLTTEVPTIVVTSDLAVIGWGIELPPDVGALVAARSLDAVLAASATANPAVD